MKDEYAITQSQEIGNKNRQRAPTESNFTMEQSDKVIDENSENVAAISPAPIDIQVPQLNQ